MKDKILEQKKETETLNKHWEAQLQPAKSEYLDFQGKLLRKKQ